MRDTTTYCAERRQAELYLDRVPEYFHVFEKTGPYVVSVKFDDPRISISKRRCSAQDLIGLIDASTGTFFTVMRFDNHPYRILRINMDFAGGTIKIVTKPFDHVRLGH